MILPWYIAIPSSAHFQQPSFWVSHIQLGSPILIQGFVNHQTFLFVKVVLKWEDQMFPTDTLHILTAVCLFVCTSPCNDYYNISRTIVRPIWRKEQNQVIIIRKYQTCKHNTVTDLNSLFVRFVTRHITRSISHILSRTFLLLSTSHILPHQERYEDWY